MNLSATRTSVCMYRHDMVWPIVRAQCSMCTINNAVILSSTGVSDLLLSFDNAAFRSKELQKKQRKGRGMKGEDEEAKTREQKERRKKENTRRRDYDYGSGDGGDSDTATITTTTTFGSTAKGARVDSNNTNAINDLHGTASSDTAAIAKVDLAYLLHFHHPARSICASAEDSMLHTLRTLGENRVRYDMHRNFYYYRNMA